MKAYFALITLLFVLGFYFFPIAECSGAIYYIRADGGDSAQCTGNTNAAYPGSGSNQACALSHPFYLLDTSGNWKIQGGDTVFIGPGSYMMGYGAPNTNSWCDAAGAFACHLPSLPSGDENNPTRILGSGWDSG